LWSLFLPDGSAPHDTEFLLQRPLHRVASTDFNAAGSTAENHPGCIHIRMIAMTALHADKHRLRHPALCLDMRADRAGLRGEGRTDLDQRAAHQTQLADEKLDHPAPAGIENPSIETRLLGHLLSWLFQGSSGAPDHVGNLQVLDDYHAVVLGVAVAEGLEKVLSLATCLAMKSGDFQSGLFLVLATSQLSSRSPLGSGQSLLALLTKGRVGGELTVAIGDRHDDAPVKADGWQGRRGRFWHLDLAADADEPGINVSLEGAGLGSALKGTVKHHFHRPKLGEDEGLSLHPEGLEVRLAEAHLVLASLLETWRACRASKAALPGLVEFSQHLVAGIARHIGKPGHLGAKRGQLVHLVDGRVELLLSFGPAEPHQPLLKSKVPEPASGSCPATKASFLLTRRVDPVAVGTTNQHFIPERRSSRGWRSDGTGERACPTRRPKHP